MVAVYPLIDEICVGVAGRQTAGASRKTDSNLVVLFTHSNNLLSHILILLANSDNTSALRCWLRQPLTPAAPFLHVKLATRILNQYISR